ncbi:MAG: SurA N-terminal domain-containing protein [Bacteroidales bacterium]|nr:SurA N-terminal domain-containing protein [Bacteroidales bacterium]
MATLQSLRNRAGVFLTVLIGLALLAFILGDLFNNGNSIFQDNDTIGKVDGEKIKLQEYQYEIENAENFYKMTQGISLNEGMQTQLRESVWRQIINDKVFAKVYENAGVEVSANEILDMVAGNHISPMMRQFFTDPNTGMYNSVAATNFVQAVSSDDEMVDPRSRQIWNNIQSNMIRERLNTKYMVALAKGLYTTKAEKEAEAALRSKTADVAFVGVRYTSIPDSAITVKKSEVEKVYNQFKENYKVDATRDIVYVTFPIAATEEDVESIKNSVADMISDFSSAEDAEAYAQMNSQNPTASRFMTEAQLPSILASAVANLKEGEVFGPYREGDSFKISRLVSVAQRPDSVKAAHILLRNNVDKADSLFAAAKKGANFAAMARTYSEDPGSAVNGGDLDWFTDGMMVPEFNEACFTGAKGDIVKVESQYGIHIIKIQDKGVAVKKYNFATIDKAIEYSSKTHQMVYSDAQTFATQHTTRASFEAAIDTLNLVKRYGNNIRQNAYSINNLRSARDLVKWAFKADIDEVSELFEINDQFVIALLVREQSKGYASVADVEAVITNDILKDKKAALVAESVKGMSLAQIAEKYSVKVDSASHVNYAINSVSGAGIEPALVGQIMAAAENVQSGVVRGQNAAYVFSVKQFEANPAAAEYSNSQLINAFTNYAYQVILDVDTEDNRIKFY